MESMTEAMVEKTDAPLNPGAVDPPTMAERSFQERMQALEDQKTALVADAKKRLLELAAWRARIDSEEERLRAFLGHDVTTPPEPEKKPKAPRGSVRGPVRDYYRDNATLQTAEGIPTSVVAKETGLDLDQVQGAAAKLAKDGLLERVGKSSYRWKALAA